MYFQNLSFILLNKRNFLFSFPSVNKKKIYCIFFVFLCFSGSGSSDGADNGTNEKLSPGSKLSEFTSPSPGPSSGNSYSLLQSDNVSFFIFT